MEFEKNIKNVLFLDIDGVLNRAEYGKDLYEDTYDDYCLALHRPSIKALKKLLDKNDELKIVWISDWAKVNEKTYGNGNDSIINPLLALSLFSWLNCRVIGNIFTGNWIAASGGAKILAIKDFIEKHLVESYAILDDDEYDMHGDIKCMFKHFVHINALKSFLEDDIPLVDKALSIPMDKTTMHKVFLDLGHSDTFVVNHRYRCSFDFAQHSQKKPPLFTPFAKDINCPRQTSEVDVLVYDIQTNEHLLGKVMLVIDNDLDNRYDTMICTKPLGSSKWTTTSTIIELTDIKKSTKDNTL